MLLSSGSKNIIIIITFIYSADDLANSRWTHSVNRSTGEVADVNSMIGPVTGQTHAT
jgi:hypothetical protein